MKKFLMGFKDFIKKEIVLCVSLFLAVISSFYCLPDKKYLDYIDFRTLSILFCLMAIMAGFKRAGVFKQIAVMLLKKVSSISGVVTILTFLCFFFSMLITNDVALITFVPFTFTVLGLLKDEKIQKLSLPTVCLQTIAANLGSMLTPIGNPQNLYLYGRAGLSFTEFIMLMLPYSAVSFLLLGICLLLISINTRSFGKINLDNYILERQEESTLGSPQKSKAKFIAVLGILFAISLLTVIRLIPYYVVLLVVVLTLVFLNKRLFKEVDYSLLITFVCLFIFIGNMSRIDVFKNLIENLIEGHEFALSIIASQVISNVPAAILLSGFTDYYRALIVGTNLGGLGTLIASMASLISMKIFSKERPMEKGKYFLVFTAANLIFLLVLVGVSVLYLD